MSTALRAFVVVPVSLILFAFVGAAFAQEDTDANEACPSAPDVYVYVSDVKYLEKVNGKVNLYGRKCVDYESGDKAAEGICTGPKRCKANLCDGKPCALPPIKVQDVQKAVYGNTPPPAVVPPPSLSDTGDVSGLTQNPVPPGTNQSLAEQALFNPTPLAEQKDTLSPSANSVGEVLKRAETQPGVIDKIRDFFSPAPLNPNQDTFQLQPTKYDDFGNEIPQTVGPKTDSFTGPDSTFTENREQMQLTDTPACDSWMSCMREKVSNLFNPTDLEEASLKKLQTNWNFGNMKNCSGGVCSGYQSFATPEEGAKADINNIAKWVDRGDDTLNKLMNRLSPQSDGNDTRGMVNYLSDKLGISPNTRLDLSNETQIVNLFNEKAFLEHSVRATDVMPSREIIGAYQSVAQRYGFEGDSQVVSQVPLPQSNPLVGGSYSYGPAEASGFDNLAAYNYFNDDNTATWAEVARVENLASNDSLSGGRVGTGDEDIVFAGPTATEIQLANEYNGTVEDWNAGFAAVPPTLAVEHNGTITDWNAGFAVVPPTIAAELNGSVADWTAGFAAVPPTLATEQSGTVDDWNAGFADAEYKDQAALDQVARNDADIAANDAERRAALVEYDKQKAAEVESARKLEEARHAVDNAANDSERRTALEEYDRQKAAQIELEKTIRADQLAWDGANKQTALDEEAARQQILNDEKAALEDRKARADEETTAYQKSLKDAESKVLVPDTVVVDAQKSVEEAIAADKRAARDEELQKIITSDQAAWDGANAAKGADQKVLDSIKNEQVAAQAAVDAAQKRLDAANTDAQIAELTGGRQCADTGFIQCPATTAAHQLAVAKDRLETVNSNYTQCQAGNCPGSIVDAKAQAEKGQGATSAWFKAAEESFASDLSKRVDALRKGTLASPMELAYVLSDGLGYAATWAPRTLLEGTTVGEYLGFRGTPDEVIGRAANPDRDLEDKITAGRDIAMLTVPVAADLSISSKGFSALGNWTTAGREAGALGTDLAPAAGAVERELGVVGSEKSWLQSTREYFGFGEKPSTPTALTQAERDALVAGDQGPVIEPKVKTGSPDVNITKPEIAMGDEGAIPQKIPTPIEPVAVEKPSLLERWFGKSEPPAAVETPKAAVAPETAPAPKVDAPAPRVEPTPPEITPTPKPVEPAVVAPEPVAPKAVEPAASAEIAPAAEKSWLGKKWDDLKSSFGYGEKPIEPLKSPTQAEIDEAAIQRMAGEGPTPAKTPAPETAPAPKAAEAPAPRAEPAPAETAPPARPTTEPAPVEPVKRGSGDVSKPNAEIAMGDEGPVALKPGAENPSGKVWNDKTLTRDEFIADYKAVYPKTTLTDAQLAERYAAGKRLNPQTGQLKVPETPAGTPAAPAVAGTPSLLSRATSWMGDNKIKTMWIAVGGLVVGNTAREIYNMFTYSSPPENKTPAAPIPPVVAPPAPEAEVPPPPVVRKDVVLPPVTRRDVVQTGYPDNSNTGGGNFCITSVNPVVVIPNTQPGPGCYNNPGQNSAWRTFPPMPPAPPPSTPTPTPTTPTPTKPPVTPTPTPTPTTTPTVLKPYATLIANPPAVVFGGKSRLIWSSVNTSSCELFAPGNVSMATSTRGSTSTLPLATTTQFTLNCSSATGATTSAQTTVTVH